MDSPFWIYSVGLIAQVFYTGRVLIKWFLSEKSHKNESPTIYWVFSFIGSILLFVYGWLRDDFSIIFGEFLTYYIYMWNLGEKGMFKCVPRWVHLVVTLIPLLGVAVCLHNVSDLFSMKFLNESIPLWLMIFGMSGQAVYKSRFLYQFFYSFKRKESLLPLGFWAISVVGSLMIISYALIRHDWVLLIGQFGIVPSIRNIMIAISKDKGK